MNKLNKLIERELSRDIDYDDDVLADTSENIEGEMEADELLAEVGEKADNSWKLDSVENEDEQVESVEDAEFRDRFDLHALNEREKREHFKKRDDAAFKAKRQQVREQTNVDWENYKRDGNGYFLHSDVYWFALPKMQRLEGELLRFGEHSETAHEWAEEFAEKFMKSVYNGLDVKTEFYFYVNRAVNNHKNDVLKRITGWRPSGVTPRYPDFATTVRSKAGLEVPSTDEEALEGEMMDNPDIWISDTTWGDLIDQYGNKKKQKRKNAAFLKKPFEEQGFRSEFEKESSVEYLIKRIKGRVTFESEFDENVLFWRFMGLDHTEIAKKLGATYDMVAKGWGRVNKLTSAADMRFYG